MVVVLKPLKNAQVAKVCSAFGKLFAGRQSVMGNWPGARASIINNWPTVRSYRQPRWYRGASDGPGQRAVADAKWRIP